MPSFEHLCLIVQLVVVATVVVLKSSLCNELGKIPFGLQAATIASLTNCCNACRCIDGKAIFGLQVTFVTWSDCRYIRIL